MGIDRFSEALDRGVAGSGAGALVQIGQRGALVVGEIGGAIGRRQRRHQVDAQQPTF